MPALFKIVDFNMAVPLSLLTSLGFIPASFHEGRNHSARALPHNSAGDLYVFHGDAFGGIRAQEDGQCCDLWWLQHTLLRNKHPSRARGRGMPSRPD
jgi:hypothetical protein